MQTGITQVDGIIQTGITNVGEQGTVLINQFGEQGTVLINQFGEQGTVLVDQVINDFGATVQDTASLVRTELSGLAREVDHRAHNRISQFKNLNPLRKTDYEDIPEESNESSDEEVAEEEVQLVETNQQVIFLPEKVGIDPSLFHHPHS